MKFFNTCPQHCTGLNHFSQRASCLVAVTLITFAAASQCYGQTTPSMSSQSWNYKVYNNAGNMSLGYITVEPKDNGSNLRMFGANLNFCNRSTLKTTVEKNEVNTIITPVATTPDCLVRYVVKNDGTGGVRETKVGDAWVPDGMDRDLTPKK